MKQNKYQAEPAPGRGWNPACSAAALLIPLLLLLAACGSGSTAPPPGNPGGTTPAVTGIDFTVAQLELGIGETKTLAVTFTPERASAGLTFTSADTGIATVNSAGAVTGVAAGSTTMTASVTGEPGIQATAAVTVRSTTAAREPGVDWTKQFGTAGHNTRVNAMAVDSAGNLIITGRTDRNEDGDGERLGKEHVFVSKHAPDGEIIWTRGFGTAGTDAGTAVTVDADDAIIVAGFAEGPLTGEDAGRSSGRQSAFIRKYTAAGDVAWTAQSNGSIPERATGVTVDSAGRVTITGFLADPGRDNRAFVRQYVPTSDGSGMEETWTSQPEYGDGGTPELADIISDADGNVIAVGSIREKTGDRNFADLNMLAVKYDQDGELLWQRSYDAGHDKFVGDDGERLRGHHALEDRAYAVAAGPAGSIYLTGYMRMANIDAMYLIAHEPAVLKIAGADGEEEWRSLPDYAPTPDPDSDEEFDDAEFRRNSGQGAAGRAITVAGDGSAYMAAYTMPKHPTYEHGGRDDLPALLTYGLTPDGGEAWRDDYGTYGYEAGSYVVSGIALGGESALYVTGTVSYGLGDLDYEPGGSEPAGKYDYYIRKYTLAD